MAIFLTALAAFAGGMLIAYFNYLITRAFLTKSKTGSAGLPRSMISAVFIACLYLIGVKTRLNMYALLIGGVLGCTAGTVLFTCLLIKANREGELGKEQDADGRSE